MCNFDLQETCMTHPSHILPNLENSIAHVWLVKTSPIMSIPLDPHFSAKSHICKPFCCNAITRPSALVLCIQISEANLPFSVSTSTHSGLNDLLWHGSIKSLSNISLLLVPTPIGTDLLWPLHDLHRLPSTCVSTSHFTFARHLWASSLGVSVCYCFGELPNSVLLSIVVACDFFFASANEDTQQEDRARKSTRSWTTTNFAEWLPM